MRSLLLALALVITPSLVRAETPAAQSSKLGDILGRVFSAKEVSYLRLHFAGPLMTNGGSIDNETNNVFTFTENSEDATFTASTNLWTWASSTSATFAFTPAVAFTGDATLNGGAGALTFGAASSTIVTTDNAATGLCAGSTGALSTWCLDTTDSAEGVAITGYQSVSGVSTVGALLTSATRNTGTGGTLTTSTSGGLHVANAASDAATTYILPAASTKAKYCFAIDAVTGSNRELQIQTPAGSDLIVGTTTAAGGTGIATTAGASHGIKNTHATAVRGNGVCVQADGTNTWYMFGISGTWAAY